MFCFIYWCHLLFICFDLCGDNLYNHTCYFLVRKLNWKIIENCFFLWVYFFFIKIDYIKIFSQYVPKTNEKQCHHTYNGCVFIDPCHYFFLDMTIFDSFLNIIIFNPILLSQYSRDRKKTDQLKKDALNYIELPQYNVKC